MDAQRSSPAQRQLAQLARQRFVEGLCAGLSGVSQALLDFLIDLSSQTATQREMQERRDSWVRYQAQRGAWSGGVTKAWRGSLAPQATTARGTLVPSPGSFELLSDDVVENKILASRMALTVTEHAGQAMDAVRQCTQLLQGREVDNFDILRPETVCLLLVDQWVDAGLLRTDLQRVQDPLQNALAALALEQYERVNQFYEAQGIAPTDDLRSRVRRTVGGASLISSGGLDSGSRGAFKSASDFSPTGHAMSGTPLVPGTATAGATPLARARQRAQGVMGQLHRLLTQQRAGTDVARAAPASTTLIHALTAHRVQADMYYSSLATLVEDYSPAGVVRAQSAVRERSAALKRQASTAGEKAIIEVVALMFQSILSEDRIPPVIRVWFARLQVPVLRVALAEPEFFSNLSHPARQLIDRMGACVLGFDGASISGSAMEAEIRRIVQVIEQYPETGRRVFQLVHDEFEKFLAKFLTEKQVMSRLVSVAQQLEQKEALAIQYTIEMRTLLKDMPVREEIRDFLFKTWPEVLAVSAVRQGGHHEDTVSFKQSAADLVWAASAKPSRADRATVIQNLPRLLARLRQGLALVGVVGPQQDAQIKVLTDTLADAFMSRTAAIPQAHIEMLAKRLANLEDYISDATLGDMPLSADSIEMLLGIDASSIHVVADNGAPVQESALAWARELQVGAWFSLDHNGAAIPVQYVWHSERKQLHLFAAMDGCSYLIQLRRLGAYLQTGLLVSQEEEGLTVRAARDALTKLDANPERLLN